MKRFVVLIAVLSALLVFVSCSGGGGGDLLPVPITSHTVTLNWAANHEKGVNSPGGGYLVSVSSSTNVIDVPYVSGLTTTTTTSVVLNTGRYTVKVSAYAALDSHGSTSGSISAPSSITVRVP